MITDDRRTVPFPDEAVRHYRDAGLWGTATIAEQFHAAAQQHADRCAVVALDGRSTYRELDQRTDRVAAGMLALGLRPGDTVLFQVTNRLAAVIAWYGVLKAGLVPVCTLVQHRAHEIGEISRRVGAVAHLVEAGTRGFDLVAFAREQRRGHSTLRHLLAIGEPAGGPAPSPAGADPVDVATLGADLDAGAARRIVADVQRGIAPDAVAVLQLSGGTTGTPKLIPRRHAEYWYNAVAYARRLGWTADVRVGHLIPMIHNAGISCAVHPAHSVGATLVLTPADLDVALPLLAAERVTDALLGHGHWGVVDHPAFPVLTAGLQRVVLSGAKVPPSLFAAFERAGVWSGQMFGMGEGLFTVTALDAPREARATTVGTAISELDEVVVLEPGDTTPVPDGRVGELCCRGPYTIRGYLDAAEHDAQVFTPDGFYRTGDLAALRMIDGERYLCLEGRLKDVINRGGEKINAGEVELLLMRHPRVRQAAVVAMPDRRLGERACAFVVVADDAPLPLHAVQEHLDALQVAKFKWPERVETLADLPRTSVNKVDKKTLRAHIGAVVADERQGDHP